MAWLERIRRWQYTRRARRAACERALAEFARTHDEPAMGAHVLRADARGTVVRVMYMAGHIPPERCWYLVSIGNAAVRMLSFDDVKLLESPWR
jgi:hypothetical protein